MNIIDLSEIKAGDEIELIPVYFNHLDLKFKVISVIFRQTKIEDFYECSSIYNVENNKYTTGEYKWGYVIKLTPIDSECLASSYCLKYESTSEVVQLVQYIGTDVYRVKNKCKLIKRVE